MNDLEKARRELYHAAQAYAYFTTADRDGLIADDDRMASVIARLEVAAEKFAGIKNAAQ